MRAGFHQRAEVCHAGGSCKPGAIHSRQRRQLRNHRTSWHPALGLEATNNRLLRRTGTAMTCAVSLPNSPRDHPRQPVRSLPELQARFVVLASEIGTRELSATARHSKDLGERAAVGDVAGDVVYRIGAFMCSRPSECAVRRPSGGRYLPL